MSEMDEYLNDLYIFRQKLERSGMNRHVNNNDVFNNYNETSPSSSEASSSPDQKRLLRLINKIFSC